MIGTVIITHGTLAQELKAAAELIVGGLEGCEAVSIHPGEDMNEAENRIREAIKRVDNGKGALILTDLFGGTPSNLSLTFLESDRVEVVSGVNLPMLLSLATGRGEKSLAELAEKAMEAGKKNITVASKILNMKVSFSKNKGD